MNILETDARKISLALLQPNEGQLEEIGIHANPRQITEDQYQTLKASMQADNLTGAMPLKVYEHEGKYVVLGGNMRLRVLQEIGVKDAPCIVLPKETPAPVLNKFIITDNSTFGEWDMDALANEWADEPLKDWGVDVPETKEEGEKDDLSNEITLEYKVEVTCKCESEQEALYNELIGKGYECRILTL